MQKPQGMGGSRSSDPILVAPSPFLSHASGMDATHLSRGPAGSLLHARQYHSAISLGDLSASDSRDSEDAHSKVAHQPRYGVGVTHQWTCPLVCLRLEQAGTAVNSSLPPGAFCLHLSNVHTRAALEGSSKDIRFSIASFSLEDLAEAAVRGKIIQSVPDCIRGVSRRALLLRTFQVWRLRTAERSRIARHMHVSAQHLRVTAESQLFGHVTYSPDGTGISFDIGKILSIAVELGTVERAMQTACSLMKAAATGLKAGDLQRGQPHAANVRPCKDKEVGAKALTLHVHVHCVQIEALLENKSFARVASEDLGILRNSNPKDSDGEKLDIRCGCLQV
ncbi:hypothetical protein WJX75_006423 [Coccomyxa subellipsoidea]|uniref:Uncharacterized protein n=1 Tax=Coccomyxa subellipsoidea TaxID=248742 RepID=A0ABR2YVN8_9CHLO